MATTISCDVFTWFFVIAIGLLFAAALATRGSGRSPTGIAEKGGDRLPEWPDGIANPVPGGTRETGPGCGRTSGTESEFPSLEAYARQFEEAIEQIRLRHQDFRRRK
jgi:hypothetical protein